MSYFGGWIAVCVLLGLGQAWASFSTPFEISKVKEDGGYACYVVEGFLCCLGGSSNMFVAVNLTSDQLSVTSFGNCSRVNHALLSYGTKLIALGGIHGDLPVDFLALYDDINFSNNNGQAGSHRICHLLFSLLADNTPAQHCIGLEIGNCFLSGSDWYRSLRRGFIDL